MNASRTSCRTLETPTQPRYSKSRAKRLKHWSDATHSLLMYRGFGTLALIHSSTSLSSICFTRSLSGFRAARSDSLRPRLPRRSREYGEIMSMEPKGKRKASGASSASSGATLETPDWFKSDRVRCLTDVSTPRDQGEALRAVAGSSPRRRVIMRTHGRSTGSLHHVVLAVRYQRGVSSSWCMGDCGLSCCDWSLYFLAPHMIM